MRFFMLAIAAIAVSRPGRAQVPTDSISQLYLTACHMGMMEAQNALPDRVDKAKVLRGGNEGCDTSLARLTASGDLRHQTDIGLFACGVATGFTFAQYGLGGEINPPSKRFTRAYDDCLSGLWAENRLSPDNQTRFTSWQVRRFLRYLVTAEEVFFADSVRYSENVAALDLRIPLSVRASVSIIGDGYRAAASHASGLSCHIFVGTEAQMPGRKEGEPWCDQ